MTRGLNFFGFKKKVYLELSNKTKSLISFAVPHSRSEPWFSHRFSHEAAYFVTVEIRSLLFNLIKIGIYKICKFYSLVFEFLKRYTRQVKSDLNKLQSTI